MSSSSRNISKSIHDHCQLQVGVFLKGKTFLEMPSLQDIHVGHYDDIVGHQIHVYFFKDPPAPSLHL